MITTMKSRTVSRPGAMTCLALCLGLAGLLCGPASSWPGQDGARPTSVQLFNACASCHTPPLMDLPTDRAWVNGIRQTA